MDYVATSHSTEHCPPIPNGRNMPSEAKLGAFLLHSAICRCKKATLPKGKK